MNQIDVLIPNKLFHIHSLKKWHFRVLYGNYFEWTFFYRYFFIDKSHAGTPFLLFSLLFDFFSIISLIFSIIPIILIFRYYCVMV